MTSVEPWKCLNCGHDIFMHAKGGYIDQIKEPTFVGRMRWREYGDMVVCAKCLESTNAMIEPESAPR